MGIFIEDTIHIDFKTSLLGQKYANFDKNTVFLSFNKDRQKWHLDNCSAQIYENKQSKRVLLQLNLNFEVQDISNIINEIYDKMKSNFQNTSDDI